MATPTRTNQENFFALENKLGQQSKRSPSISLMSIPFLRDRSTSVCRKQVATVNANPSIFRRIERSPSANRLSEITLIVIALLFRT